MTGITLAITAVTFIFAASAVYGLVWAVRHDQFRSPQATARSIFDEEEPIGRPTDRFPDKRPAGAPAPRPTNAKPVEDR